MFDTEEIVRRYLDIASQYRRDKAEAVQALSNYINGLISVEGFSDTLYSRVWSACASRYDAKALQKANGGLPPMKKFYAEVRNTQSYREELYRLICSDKQYIFTQTAMKHPKEFCTERGIRLLQKAVNGEKRERLLSLYNTVLLAGDADFVPEYLASLNFETLRGEIFNAMCLFAEERVRKTRALKEDSFRMLFRGEASNPIPEKLFYTVLGTENYGQFCTCLAECTLRVLPFQKSVEEIARQLEITGLLLTGIEDKLEQTGLDAVISEELAAAFPTERFISLAKQNIHLGPKLKAEIEAWERAEKRKKELRYNIVTSMPETYKDLYPATRVMRRCFILHSGPTNSGKTFAGMEALKKSENVVYLGPLRMLALEKADELNESGFPCSLKTGEEERLVEGARFTASTIELADLSRKYACAVIDECQMMTDSVRGGAWTAAILGLQAEEIHVCLSPWALNIVIELIRDCGDDWTVVKHQRMTPLSAEDRFIAFPSGIQDYDALIAFSRRSVHAIAARLEQTGRRCSIIYGNLPYDVRQNEAAKFRRGETRVVVATDAIGMGLNLPIRRVVFMESEKFDGKTVRRLEDEEIRQIAGRAGRRGIFEEGFVTSAVPGFNRAISSAICRFQSENITPMFGFPQQLLGIESPVSQLMKEWEAIPPAPGFRKADLSEQCFLAQEAEKLIADRRTVYTLSMIPFDTKAEDLFGVWQMLTGLLSKNMLAKAVIPEINTAGKLLELEHLFRVYDIYFQFGRLFEDDTLKNNAMRQKETVSRMIIRLLDEKGKETRHCKVCGSPLPWNSTYPLCETCFRRRR